MQSTTLPNTPDDKFEFSSNITVRLVNKMGSDEFICNAARVSTSDEPDFKIGREKQQGLISYLLKHRHGTPFEHGSMTFFVQAPIIVWREHHRHRIGFSYNEESGRYKQLRPKFYIPEVNRPMIPTAEHTSARPCFRPADATIHQNLVINLKGQYIQAYHLYENILSQNIAKEVARLCLPVAIFSTCYVTCNPRSLMHFLSLRTQRLDAAFVSYPQWEIQQVANQYEGLFRMYFPMTYKAFEESGRVAP
jgi:thymidylate synthase (FAD)